MSNPPLQGSNPLSKGSNTPSQGSNTPSKRLLQHSPTWRTLRVAIRFLSRFLRLVIRPTLPICAALILLGTIAPTLDAVGQQPDIHLAMSSNVSLLEPTRKEIAGIFLGQKRQWSDGTRIKIAILDSAVEQRSFLDAVVDRSPSQYWAHWRNIVFSGRGIMPKIFSSEEELLNYLAEEEGVIGHITDNNLVAREGAVTLTLTIDGVWQQ